MDSIEIPIYRNLSKEQFDALVRLDKPFIIGDIEFGQCIQKWNADYLTNRMGEQTVTIHRSAESALVFRKKNFSYAKMPFGEFLRNCQENANEYFYLRSIGLDRRGKEIADIKKHFPAIGDDIDYPSFIDFCLDPNCEHSDCSGRTVFSTVLRISSKDITMWGHYDVVDNILLQICGRKTVTLFPPSDASMLYMCDDKSFIDNFYEENIEAKFPMLKEADRYEAILHPGQGIFIPDYWFHTTKALDFSIGINCFWRKAELAHLYQPGDTYGNKDFAPGARILNTIDRSKPQLDELPTKYRNFFIDIAIQKLLSLKE